MDHLFPHFQQNQAKIASFEISDTSLADLQTKLGLGMNEALEMYCKFQLAKAGQTSLQKHIVDCSICKHKNVCLLLNEYGAELNGEEKKHIQEKTQGWCGYYLIADSLTIVDCLALPESLHRKVLAALRKIKGRHTW